MNDIFWESYREEMIATALVLVLAVLVSLFAVRSWYSSASEERQAEQTYKQKLQQEEIADQLTTALGLALGESTDTGYDELPVQGITPKPTAPPPTPEAVGDAVEVPFGVVGKYTYDGYEFGIDRPRLRLGNDQNERTFIADLELRNLSIMEGLPLQVAGTIVQDGKVIVSNTPMTTSVSGVVMPGDTMKFQARISLLDGTDISHILYKPLNVVDTVTHELKPKVQ